MINSLIGTKKQMTSVYDSRGRRVGATIIEVTPNFVTQIKTEETKDGYKAVQIGAGAKKSVRKPQLGHLKKAGVNQSVRWLREVAMGEEEVSLGQEINVGDVFKAGDLVKVTGTSKGRGFQGGVKRYNFAGGPKTHGQSDRHRAPGSIGAGTTPGRVYKGKRMAGHMGVDTVTVANLEVISVDKVNNLMTVKGGVPGAPTGLLTIRKIGQVKGYVAPVEEEEVVEETPEQETEVTEETGETEEVAQSTEAEEAPEEETKEE